QVNARVHQARIVGPDGQRTPGAVREVSRHEDLTHRDLQFASRLPRPSAFKSVHSVTPGTSSWGAADPFGEAYAERWSCRGMDVLVTGATGFVGANVARLLSAGGRRVRVLARPASSLKALDGCAVDVVRGDILDPASVAEAIRGCAHVFHVAADYRLWAK